MTDLDVTPRLLRTMWELHDPMPADLVDKVLVAIATEDLDAEYELLHLMERAHELVGTRGAGDAYTVTFSRGEFSLLLRVGTRHEGDTERRRVDGWVTPPRPMTVKAAQAEHSWEATADASGRFEFADLPGGLTRFWLSDDPEGIEASDDEASRAFATPAFEL